MKTVDIKPGQFLNQDQDGHITVEDVATDKVTYVVCRREADFGPKWGLEIPPTAAFCPCHRCGARVVYNPNNPASTKMVADGAVRLCMQCCKIEPMPELS